MKLGRQWLRAVGVAELAVGTAALAAVLGSLDESPRLAVGAFAVSALLAALGTAALGAVLPLHSCGRPRRRSRAWGIRLLTTGVLTALG